MEKFTYSRKDQKGFRPNRYSGNTYDAIDNRFDLVGVRGFHGTSCYRWSIPVNKEARGYKKNTSRPRSLRRDTITI